jgi:hypothetical protein
MLRYMKGSEHQPPPHHDEAAVLRHQIALYDLLLDRDRNVGTPRMRERDGPSSPSRTCGLPGGALWTSTSSTTISWRAATSPDANAFVKCCAMPSFLDLSAAIGTRAGRRTVQRPLAAAQ